MLDIAFLYIYLSGFHFRLSLSPSLAARQRTSTGSSLLSAPINGDLTNDKVGLV